MTRTHALARLGAPLALLAALVASGPAAAQSKVGTTFGDFLMLEPSASIAAQGNVGATARTGAIAAYYNPGALGFQDGPNAGFSHAAWFDGIDYNHAAVAIQMGSASAFSLSVTSLSSGDIAVTTAEQPLGTGELYSVEDLAIGLGYGRRFTDRFAGGATVKYVQETIWHTAARTIALDAGVIYDLPFGATLGASITNFGTPATFDGTDLRIRFDQNPDVYGDNDNLPAALETEGYALPVFFRVGMSYPVRVGDSQLTLAADAYQPSNNTNSVSVGGEWTYANLIWARAGYQDLFQQDAEGGLRLGGGLHTRVSGFDLSFDYAWADHGTRLGSTQRFTLGIGF